VQLFTLTFFRSNNQIFEENSQDSESSEWLFFRFSLRPDTNVQRGFVFSKQMAITCPPPTRGDARWQPTGGRQPAGNAGAKRQSGGVKKANP